MSSRVGVISFQCGFYQQFTTFFLLGTAGNQHIWLFLALPTTKAHKDIVFRFIIEYSSLRDFAP
jgi:hypothetical protein